VPLSVKLRSASTHQASRHAKFPISIRRTRFRGLPDVAQRPFGTRSAERSREGASATCRLRLQDRLGTRKRWRRRKSRRGGIDCPSIARRCAAAAARAGAQGDSEFPPGNR